MGSWQFFLFLIVGYLYFFRGLELTKLNWLNVLYRVNPKLQVSISCRVVPSFYISNMKVHAHAVHQRNEPFLDAFDWGRSGHVCPPFNFYFLFVANTYTCWHQTLKHQSATCSCCTFYNFWLSEMGIEVHFGISDFGKFLHISRKNRS